MSDAALIARLPALEIISVMGVGYDGIDVAAARARGVIVTHTPDSTAEPARWTAVIDQMLAHRSVRRHKPEPVTDAQYLGPDGGR